MQFNFVNTQLSVFIGGYFGAGWFRDLWRIPEYVREANNEPGYVENLKQKMREYDSPPFKVRQKSIPADLPFLATKSDYNYVCGYVLGRPILGNDSGL